MRLIQHPWFHHIWLACHPMSPPSPCFPHMPTLDPYRGPSDTPIMTAQPKLHRITQTPHYFYFWPKVFPHHCAGVHYKFSRDAPSDKPSSSPSSFTIKSLPTLPIWGSFIFSRKTQSGEPSSHPFTPSRKIHKNTPATHLLQTYTQRTPFHTLKIPPI